MSRRVTICSECPKVAESSPRGRPRKTCGWDCSLRRQRRLAREYREDDIVASRNWWLSLSEEQRLAAMAYVRINPPPNYFSGGKQAWAYFSRHAISCEGVVVAGVR